MSSVAGPETPTAPAENLNLRFSQRLIRLKAQASFLTVDLSFLSPPWKRALLRGRAGRGRAGGASKQPSRKGQNKAALFEGGGGSLRVSFSVSSQSPAGPEELLFLRL